MLCEPWRALHPAGVWQRDQGAWRSVTAWRGTQKQALSDDCRRPGARLSESSEEAYNIFGVRPEDFTQGSSRKTGPPERIPESARVIQSTARVLPWLTSCFTTAGAGYALRVAPSPRFFMRPSRVRPVGAAPMRFGERSVK